MTIGLTSDDQPVILMASCLGDGDKGGGLLYLDGRNWMVIDDVSTTGLFTCENELIRMLWAPSQVESGTSILHYTADGCAREVIVKGLSDPHDVLWNGQHYVAVSSLQDSVLWVAPEGEVIKRFQPVQGADCWHLNSLLMREGVLYATAFGRSEESRGWAGHQLDGTRMLFRLDDGRDVLTGLCCPHTPRFESGEWLVCNSATSELRSSTAEGDLIRCVQLQDWVRGMAITDQYILAGESVNRQLTSDVRGATVAIIDRKTWTVLGRPHLPFREVYDLVLVSAELLEGVLRLPSARLTASCPREVPRDVWSVVC